MAITIKTLKGTNSVSADRITINDNFKINTDAINQLLGIINTTTGRFDNSNIGADNTVTTKQVIVSTSGIDVQGGNINLQTGNIKAIQDGASIELGSDNSQIIDKLAIGSTGPNGDHILGLNDFVAIEVPKMTTPQLTDLVLGATGPHIITFDDTSKTFKGWNGTVWVTLG